jgi:hypothetical protein
MNFIKNLRTFYNSYKKAMEVFSGALQKANSQFEKDFLKTHAGYFAGSGDNGHPQMIDTLTQAMHKIKFSMDGLIKGLNAKVETIEKDLIDSMDVFHKHYKQENHEFLKEGTTFWNSIH